jgi:hypothetical protein
MLDCGTAMAVLVATRSRPAVTAIPAITRRTIGPVGKDFRIAAPRIGQVNVTSFEFLGCAAFPDGWSNRSHLTITIGCPLSVGAAWKTIPDNAAGYRLRVGC